MKSLLHVFNNRSKRVNEVVVVEKVETEADKRIRLEMEAQNAYYKAYEEEKVRARENMKKVEAEIRQSRGQTEIPIQLFLETLYKVRNADLFKQGAFGRGVPYYEKHSVSFEFNGYVIEAEWEFEERCFYYFKMNYDISYRIADELVLIATNSWQFDAPHVKTMFFIDTSANQDSKNYFKELIDGEFSEPVEWTCYGKENDLYVRRKLLSTDLENIVWLHDTEEPWMQNFADTLATLSTLADAKEQAEIEAEIERIEQERNKKMERFLKKTQLLQEYFQA